MVSNADSIGMTGKVSCSHDFTFLLFNAMDLEGYIRLKGKGTLVLDIHESGRQISVFECV